VIAVEEPIYDFEFDGLVRILPSPLSKLRENLDSLSKNMYDIECETDVEAISLAYAVIDAQKCPPPEHGRDIVMACAIYVTRDGSKDFLANVNYLGEVDFIR
jgi:hypothetical protein